MKTNDTIKEGTGDGGSRVGVAERKKMRILGESVDDGEDERFAAHLGQPFNEVQGDVRPHLGRNLQGLQQPHQLEGLRLVAVTHRASPHPVLDESAIAQNVENQTEAVEPLLGALMTDAMRQLRSLMAEVAEVEGEDACPVQQEASILTPRGSNAPRGVGRQAR